MKFVICIVVERGREPVRERERERERKRERERERERVLSVIRELKKFQLD